MVCSDEWEACKHKKTVKGKAAPATIMSRGLWKNVSLCIKISEPLVKVLRLAYGDGPSMASMYGELMSAKKDIKVAVENSEKDYLMITNAMNSKMSARLDSPLHMVAYILNPKYSYVDPSIFTDVEVVAALMDVMETFYFGDDIKQNKVYNIDFTKFKKKEGMFGKVAALKAMRTTILMLLIGGQIMDYKLLHCNTRP